MYIDALSQIKVKSLNRKVDIIELDEPVIKKTYVHFLGIMIKPHSFTKGKDNIGASAMPLITSFPKVVSAHADKFRKIFANANRFHHFQQYVTGLIVCNRINVQSINDAYMGHRDRSTKTRFLIEAAWSEKTMNDARIELMLSQLQGRSAKNIALVIDDTYVEKTGKSIHGVGRHWDHSQQKTILAHNTLNSHIVAKSALHFPLDFQLYIKKCTSANGPKPPPPSKANSKWHAT